MKNNLIKLSHLIFCPLLFSCILHSAQAQDTEEYVVTARNDTLRGEVKYNTYSAGNESVTLKNADKKKQNFTPNNAKAFRFRGNLYHSMLLRDHYTFMQVIEAGYMSVYEHQEMGRTTGYQDINNYLKINMGELVLIPKIGFRKKVAPLVADCPAVHRKVDDRTYDFGDLKAIAHEYNQCMATRPKTAPAQPVAAPVQANLTTPANSSVEELLTYLEKNPQTANHDDLLSCLNDINTKLRTSSTVPKYLLDALVNLSNPTEDIKEKALKLATDLGYSTGK